MGQATSLKDVSYMNMTVVLLMEEFQDNVNWNMPCNIDAATVWSNYVSFFKSEKAWMWHYNKEQLIKGPISISMLNDKCNAENDVDAAVRWTPNERVYIFKRLKYWRLYEN